MKFKIFKWFFKTSKNRNHHSSQPSPSENNLQQENIPFSTSGPQQIFQRRIPLRYNKRKCVKQYTTTSSKLKSYPTSPRRDIEEDRGYVSDYKSPTNRPIDILPLVTKSLDTESSSKTNLKSVKLPSALVYMASEQRDSTPFRPRATQDSNEPFPFLVPSDPAPRHSLFYDLSYGVDAQNAYDEEPLQKQEPIRSSNAPKMSQTVRRVSQIRRVSRIPPAHENARASITQGYEMRETPENEKLIRKTIVKVKPYRIANYNESADVHRLPLKPPKRSSVRISIDGKLLHPVNKDKIVRSLKPEGYIQSSMKIVKQSSNKELQRNSLDDMPTNDHVLNVEDSDLLIRTSEAGGRHDSSKEDNDEDDKLVYEHFHFKQNENEPVVYAVPTVAKKGRKSILQTVFPSRGRPKSILQDSAKYLTSKDHYNRPEINRKNIRVSMDTDVFASELPRRSFVQQPPMYVNMERGGNPMLVSEVLNPITSLFISDLKDPVPKDPLNKPKERNVWVKPKITPPPPPAKKQPPQILVYQEPTSNPRGIPNQKSAGRSFTPDDDEYTSSDESIIVYKRSRPSNVRKSLRKHGVYAAHTPNVRFPQYMGEKETSGQNPEQPQTDYTENADSCELQLSEDDNKAQKQNKGILLEGVEASPDHLTDFEDELDLICYPSENMLKDSPNATESKSKLRWRIIIKRGEDN